jgi:tetratricopeptide (TPR) repeat protein
VEVAFTPRVPDQARITAQLEKDRQDLGKYVPGGTAHTVMNYLVGVNTLTVSRGRTMAKLNEAMKNLKIASKRCIQDEGYQPVRKLSLYLLVRFEAALKELVEAARSAESTTALLSGAQPPAEIEVQFRKFAKYGGDFLLHAANAGLVRQNSDGAIEFIEGADFFVRLAFKVRLTIALPEATNPMDWLLSDFEREWYDIWVVERSRTASLSRKLQAIERIKRRDSSYPQYLAQGIVFYQARKYPMAVKAFKQALEEKPDDKRLKDFLAEAEDRLD